MKHFYAGFYVRNFSERRINKIDKTLHRNLGEWNDEFSSSRNKCAILNENILLIPVFVLVVLFLVFLFFCSLNSLLPV